MDVDQKDVEQYDGISLDSLPRWLRDMIDLNNESAGRETGRSRRFQHSEAESGPESDRKKEERRFSELMRRLQDPVYAALYTQAVNTINDASEASERALRKLSRDAEVANQRIQALRSSAAELPDGRKVFRSKDGRLIAEDGEDVTKDKDAIKGLSPKTSAWEEFVRARQIAEEIERQRREVETYRHEVIEPAKERLGDPNNPPAPDELEEIVRKAREKMPPSVSAQRAEAAPSAPTAGVPARNETADELFGAYSPNAPKLGSDFKRAHDDPYGSSATPLPTSAPKLA